MRGTHRGAAGDDGSAALSPGALADALSILPITIEECEVALDQVSVAGYYDEAPRPTAIVTLRGGGAAGVGESVAWSTEDQERFAAACPALVPTGARTLAEIQQATSVASAHDRAAIESAALDLALRQASTNLFVAAGRKPRPVRFCRSLGREAVTRAGGPLEALRALRAGDPAARVKLDTDPAGWSESTWRALASTRRVVVVDFKRQGDAKQVALAHRHLPTAWLEDPPLEALDAAAPWQGRVALDGYVLSAADLAPPIAAPGAVNVKAPRVGGTLEALRVLELCATNGWEAYVGGMFEVGPGRRQARILASLFTPLAWNDLAPLEPEPAPNPLPIPACFVGYGYGEDAPAPGAVGPRSASDPSNAS